MGKSTIYMAIFNSYVKLPEGIRNQPDPTSWLDSHVGYWICLVNSLRKSTDDYHA